MLHYVGIDIGGTNIKYGLLKSNGEIIEDSQIKTNTKGSEIIQSIVKIVKEYQKKFQIKAVGISAPGIILDNGFMVTGGAIHDFYGINLKITLEELIELPIFIENDANCAALAEKWLGAGSKFQSFATVVVGTGIGGGLIINNQLFRGANANAGEFGFMLVEPIKSKDTRMATLSLTGSVGCGIVNKYAEKKELEESDILDGEQIFEKMNQGDEVAKSVINDFYDRLSIGLFNLIVTFDPEIILIGGAISNNPTFISELNTRIKNIKEDHRDMTNVVFPELLPCRFFNKAGIIGAAYKAIISEK